MNDRNDGSGALGGLGVILLALACPLLCVGPLLIVALAASGVGRVLLGPLGLAAGLAVALVVSAVTWIVRQRRACVCEPRSPRHVA